MNGLNSWIDWRNMMPRDPLDVIANATFKAAVGTYTNSTTYITVPTSWATHSITYNTAPTVSALETDNQQMVADAAQWNFQHQTRSPSFSTLALALQRVAFVRGGTQWANTIQLIASGVTGPLDDWQLSFLDNAGTRGDAQGSVPVFAFGASVGGGTTADLVLTLKQFGPIKLGLRGRDTGNGNVVVMVELDLIVVP